MWILYAFGTLEIEMSCYKIWPAKTLHTLLIFLPVDAGYRRRTSINWTSNLTSQTRPILWSLFNFNKFPIVRSCHTPCVFLDNKTKTFHTKFIHAKIMTIQIRWKIYLALIQLLVIISQQNLAHATSALDSLQHKGVSKCRVHLVHQVIKSWAKIKMG